MIRTVICGGALALGLSSCALAALPTPSFQLIGDLPGGAVYSEVRGISPSGKYLVGESTSAQGTQAIIWTIDGGLQPIGTLSGGISQSTAWGVSDNGIAVGQGSFTVGNRAMRWTGSGNIVSLGTLPGGDFSRAWGISGDGTTIVGDSAITGGTQAFKYTSSMQGMGYLPGGAPTTIGTAISADKSTIVGIGTPDANTVRAVRITSAGVATLGAGANGYYARRAYAVSETGSVIAGEGGLNDNNTSAFRWTNVTGPVSLGALPGGGRTLSGLAMTSDGSMIVGSGITSAGNSTAFLWDETHGSRELKSLLLSDYGIDVGNLRLTQAVLSADGLTIGGVSINPAGVAQGFVVQLPEPGTTSFFLLAIAAMLRRVKRKMTYRSSAPHLSTEFAIRMKPMPGL